MTKEFKLKRILTAAKLDKEWYENDIFIDIDLSEKPPELHIPPEHITAYNSICRFIERLEGELKNV